MLEPARPPLPEEEAGVLVIEVPAEAVVFVDGVEHPKGPVRLEGVDRCAKLTVRNPLPGPCPVVRRGVARRTPRGEGHADAPGHVDEAYGNPRRESASSGESPAPASTVISHSACSRASSWLRS